MLKSQHLILLTLLISVLSSQACSSSSTGTATYSQSYDTVFQSSLSAAGALSWEVKVVDKESGFIQAKVPLNWRTFSNLVTIEIARRETSITTVRVSSTAPHVFDWGKNSSNVKLFLDKLDALAGPRY